MFFSLQIGFAEEGVIFSSYIIERDSRTNPYVRAENIFFLPSRLNVKRDFVPIRFQLIVSLGGFY